MADSRHLKKSQHLSNHLGSFDEIWQSYATLITGFHWTIKVQYFKNTNVADDRHLQ